MADRASWVSGFGNLSRLELKADENGD